MKMLYPEFLFLENIHIIKSHHSHHFFFHIATCSRKANSNASIFQYSYGELSSVVAAMLSADVCQLIYLSHGLGYNVLAEDLIYSNKCCSNISLLLVTLGMKIFHHRGEDPQCIAVCKWQGVQSRFVTNHMVGMQ